MTSLYGLFFQNAMKNIIFYHANGFIALSFKKMWDEYLDRHDIFLVNINEEILVAYVEDISTCFFCIQIFRPWLLQLPIA